jgi:hypothetical protein
LEEALKNSSLNMFLLNINTSSNSLRVLIYAMYYVVFISILACLYGGGANLLSSKNDFDVLLGLLTMCFVIGGVGHIVLVTIALVKSITEKLIK